MSIEQRTSNHFDFIDLLKGFGILLVVWGHTMTPRSFYIYSFHMPLFFFLSGFVHKKKPFFEFVLSKVNTLYIPYMAFSLFSWLFYLTRHLLNGQEARFPTHLTKLQSIITGTADNGGNNPIWFLTCILVVSIVFYIMTHYIQVPWIRWALLLALSLIGYRWSLTRAELLFQFDIALSGIVFFALGYVVKEHNLLRYFETIKTPRLVLFALVCEIVHIITAYYNVNLTPIRWVNMAGNVIGNYVLFYLSALAGITAFLTVGYKLQYLKILNYLGIHTLAILGIHKPVLQVFESILSPYINTNAWLYGVVASIAAIAVSLFIGQLLHRYLPFAMGKKNMIQPIPHQTAVGI